MIRLVMGAVMLALLTGCASATTGRWSFEKPGVTEADMKRDQNQCFAASVEASTDHPGLFRVDREAYRACMETRGYTVRIGQ